MPATLTRNGDKLELSLAGCRGMEFQDAREKIAQVPGRSFDWDTKMWSVPATPQVAERILKTIRPDCDDDLKNWVIASKSAHEESLTSPLPDDAADLLLEWAYDRAPWHPEVVNDNKVTGLLPYQRAAVRVMAERARAVLADDMGLGKTIQAIATVEEFSLRNGQIDGPKLIVAPASVMGGWERELHRWLEDPTIALISGRMPPKKRLAAFEEAVEGNAWVIVNWEQLRIEKVKVKKNLRNGGTRTVVETRMKNPLLESTEWLAVVADEVHRAKNRKASQTQGLWRVSGKVMLGATGTPIMNSPDELWAILHWLWPNEYGRSTPPSKAHPQGIYRMPYSSFYDEYVEHYEDHFGKKIVTGVKNPDALRFALREKLIRRTSAVLGLKGRKRIYDEVPLNPNQQKLYDEAERVMWLAVEKDIAAGNKEALEFAAKAAAGESSATLWQLPNGAARMVRLQQIIESPALLGGDDDSAIMDYCEEKIIDSRPEPWVVFFKFKESCDLFAERMRSKHGLTVGVYHGGITPATRTRLEDQFQAGEIDVMVGTIGAMKEGITLTRSHLMAFGTRDWVPDVNEQAEAREDRLGQQHQVVVFIPLAENTVATSNVEPTNRLKEGIVRTVLPKDAIKEDINP